jgi:hypothetical protein
MAFPPIAKGNRLRHGEREALGERAGAEVREDCEKAHLRGLLGTVMATYQSSGLHAVHVRLNDGRWQLFWLRDLKEVEAGENE